MLTATFETAIQANRLGQFSPGVEIPSTQAMKPRPSQE